MASTRGLPSADSMRLRQFAGAREFDRDRVAAAVFEALPAAAFTVTGARPAADTALFTLGATVRLENGWTVTSKADTEKKL